MSSANEPKKTLLFSATENMQKNIQEEGPRISFRALTPDENRSGFPAYLSRHDENGEEISNRSGRIFIQKPFTDSQNEQHIGLTFSAPIIEQSPKKNRDGLMLDSNNVPVTTEQEAAMIEKIARDDNGKPLYGPVMEVITNDSSHKGTPYGGTMLTGKVYSNEESMKIAQLSKEIGAASDEQKPDLREKMSDLKKESGEYVSMFPNKGLVLHLNQHHGMNCTAFQKPGRENENASTPSHDYDDDIPF